MGFFFLYRFRDLQTFEKRLKYKTILFGENVAHLTYYHSDNDRCYTQLR